MTTTFKCPHCGEQIEISEALTHQIEEQVLESLKVQHQKELLEVSKKAEDEAFEKLRKDFDLQIGRLEKEKEEEVIRNNKLLKELEQMNDQMRMLRRRDEERELDMKRKLAEDEEKIRKEASKQEREAVSLEIAELKKKNDDMQRALEEAKAKGTQKSQQLQGEVLELDLEEKLKNAFVYDEITPIGKGVQGADILQNVRNQNGKLAGVILWETKRAKWTKSWIPKLKEDGRKNDATMIVLVCENPPAEIDNFKVIEGVIVTSITYCLSIASVLRRNLMLIAQAKSASVNKDEKLEMLYEYIQSDAFRHRFEAFADGVKAMEEDLLTERRSMERIWKKRETELKRMQLNTSRMFGELQGVMDNKLPDIKTLELDSGE
ncbi:MAG: hypothetical protein UT24_C0012G0016 [Candidatus Woesebacteria bacterium GW2011_GWB1_39_12]|uniref:DUF2130 domain-containing protein n=2 Tax=Candidatus Woeseibacteriota TaxID=1752722 RepID=A0A0G0PGV7_9BACT|nr:MAG: hypothetical protein UT23_C0013G0024 [Candidatus Woesebacteria bacterium GW2011_GWA1_39_12]KKR00394.1 MAG: hypothetical protein UT24_C0012G0016 [Candidatus Woesebacteria bacterium GW2011_GWB1_39_12]